MVESLPYGFLELLPFGVILVTADARVRHANALARHLLARRQPLGLDDSGRLSAEPGRATRALREGLRAVAAGQRARWLWPHGPLAGPRQPVVVRAVASGRSHLAAVFVADPRALPREQTLQELHGLTPAEARVALELLQGHHLAQAARRIGTSPNTVKSQLQRIFEKLHVRRQSELVRLLMDPVAHI